jgi:succinoglycan biosynthesis protein ExoM
MPANSYSSQVSSVSNLSMTTHHISVCICTFKRSQLLRQLLERLDNQQTEGLFTYSAVVADNDGAQSAQEVVASFSTTSRLPVTYAVESRQNIALARNKAVQTAEGDFIAFIDDDEFPAEDWLLRMYQAYVKYGADGVLGPVKPHFECEPPEWVKKGNFFERRSYASGYEMNWAQASSGNLFFRKDILNKIGTPFRSEFDTAGEDVDFFRRTMEKGCSFVWCNEAIIYEVIPAWRCERRYLLRRALLRGSNFPKHPADRLMNAAKSLVAVPCYAFALPILALFGQHVFLRYLIKLLDHSSRILAYLGLRLVTGRQT